MMITISGNQKEFNVKLFNVNYLVKDREKDEDEYLRITDHVYIVAEGFSEVFSKFNEHYVDFEVSSVQDLGDVIL